jgi:branched-chain amino acid transport system substrate-binding protein
MQSTNCFKKSILLFAGGWFAVAMLLTNPLVVSAAENPILIGQSAGVSGGQAQASKDALAGVKAAFDSVNRVGGISGRTIELITEDDGGNKDRVLANTQRLVEERKVLALIGYTSGVGVENAQAYLKAAKIPMLSPLSGNMGVRKDFNRYLFHTRAGYAAEMDKLTKHLSALGLTRFAIVYLDDSGKTNSDVMRAALTRYKLTPVVDVAVSRNATSVALQVETLLQANSDAVLFITNGKPLGMIVQAMKKAGYRGYFVSSTFAGTSFVADIKEDAAGVIIAQVLPPLTKDFLKIVKDYKAHSKASSPNEKPNYTSFEAYVSARVLIEALKRAGGNVTRERIVNALESMTRLDLGGYEISFSESSHDGSNFVDTSVVSNAGEIRY